MRQLDIVITSTARNAVGYAGRCTRSVLESAVVAEARVRQVYTATDQATADDAAAGVDGMPGLEVRVADEPVLVNLYDMWSALSPATIVCWLDGDDELTPGALSWIEQVYQREDVWATYGSFIRDDGVQDWTWHPHFGRRYAPDRNAHRHEPWRASHLKTFRAGVAQRIPQSFLLAQDGGLLQTCIDLAVMLPVLDMVGQRYAVLTENTCIYNYTHSLQATRPHEFNKMEAPDRYWIAQQPPTSELHERPW